MSHMATGTIYILNDCGKWFWIHFLDDTNIRTPDKMRKFKKMKKKKNLSPK